MFCSSCGVESVQGLRYCTRCGADLNPPQPPAQAAKPRALVWIVAFGIAMMMGLPAGGIAIVFERIPALLDKGLPLWFLTVLPVFSLAMISVATVLLSRLLLPIFKTYLQSGDTAEPKGARLASAPAQIGAPGEIGTHGQVEAAPGHEPSVTEQTTRSFEPVTGERNTH